MILISKTNNFSEIKDIRRKIFSKLPLSDDDLFDKDDFVLDQFLIKNDEESVGAFRLRPVNNSNKIERMGILPKFHSKGFGKLALEEIKNLSRNSNMSRLILDSIFDVRGFYAKSGFVQDGDVYSKVGIPHVKMYFDLKFS